MTRKVPKWMRNEVGDGLMPVCPYCEAVYPDAVIFHVKNYPADGMGLLFMTCENCGKEAQFDITYEKHLLASQEYIIVPRREGEE